MKTNESNLDRIIRVIAGLALITLNLTGVVTGVLGIILLVLGAVALLTGVVGFCPLYTVLKINTHKS